MTSFLLHKLNSSTEQREEVLRRSQLFPFPETFLKKFNSLQHFFLSLSLPLSQSVDVINVTAEMRRSKVRIILMDSLLSMLTCYTSARIKKIVTSSLTAKIKRISLMALVSNELQPKKFNMAATTAA